MHRQDQFIHEVPSATLLDTIKYGAWNTDNQSITSAITNQDNISTPDDHYLLIGENTSGPTAFADISFDASVKSILDVGGGRFDCNIHYLKSTFNIDLSVWDPFNRSHEHNNNVYLSFLKKKADAVTSMSVLNVIPELTARLAHIATLKHALAVGGMAYIKIWPGEAPYKGSYTPTANDHTYQANAYADRFIREIEVVFGLGNVFLSKKTDNLITAIKHADTTTGLHEIDHIKALSTNDMLRISNLKMRAVKKRKLFDNNFNTLFSNLRFFSKVEASYIENNRHLNPSIQRAYDQRFGLSCVRK